MELERKVQRAKEPTACIALRLVANETPTLSGRSQSNGREWVGFKRQTTPGTENTRKLQLFYFIYLILFYSACFGTFREHEYRSELR
jgi:hypothetical protein